MRVDGKIIALTDQNSQAGNDGIYIQDSNSFAWYTKYNIYKGLTLIKDEPVFITLNNTVTGDYNNERLVSISAGIDSSLWALQYVENSSDYPVLKWQDITRKWYRVDGVVGSNLSAYNEISVAVVNSTGMVSLSAPVD